KVSRQKELDADITHEDQEKLLASLRTWGALDQDYRYVRGAAASDRRGYDKGRGGGKTARPTFSTPVSLSDTLNAELWRSVAHADALDMHTTMVQPVAGTGKIAQEP